MRRVKPYVVALSAIALVTMSILGTVAYLKDSTAVKNTFTVGKVDILLDEAIVDENGASVGDLDQDGKEDRTEVGNQYHLIPGKSYVKDPTITLEKGSDDSYVRMLVTVNCYDELTAIFGNPFLPQYFVDGWDNNVWVATNVVAEDDAANTATYEFRYYKTVNAKDAELKLEPLFTKIQAPTSLTGEQLATIAGLEIVVEGHAIQETGFANADEAWSNFTK